VNVTLERRARRYWVLRDDRDRVVHESSSRESAYGSAKLRGWTVLGTHLVGLKSSIRPWDYVKARLSDLKPRKRAYRRIQDEKQSDG
jgi:hypothetical protein